MSHKLPACEIFGYHVTRREAPTMKSSFFSLPIAFLACFLQLSSAQSPADWKIHDLQRPLPAVIDPGTPSTQDASGRPPSDAVVLFDGKDLAQWADKDGRGAPWKV